METTRRAWSESDRFVPRAFVRPLMRFMQLEAASGIVLLAAAVVALVWANSPLGDAYSDLWGTHVIISIGELGEHLHLDHLTLRDWVNDGLMALFFLLVGMEIKRELVLGELRDRRAAALPVLAALGGMIVPALIYVAFNAGHAGSKGWGVPMATDIAFAVGVVAILGRRVPTGAKLFLLTLAVADDLGAIVVIAIFYTSDLSLGWLAAAVAGLVVTYGLRELNVRSMVPYVVLGVLVWVALLESGVHATLAGVAFGFLTPVRPFYDPAEFGSRARRLVDQIERSFNGGLSLEEKERNEAALDDLSRLAAETASPLERVEHKLGPWVAMVIVPIFAFANAGVAISGDSVGNADGDRVLLGVALGLLVGKSVGVFGATWLTVRSGIARLPAGTTWRHVAGLAVTAGVGFTVALFVAGLAFDDPALVDSAKIGILGGSVVAGIIGFLLLRTAPLPPENRPAADDEPEPRAAMPV